MLLHGFRGRFRMLSRRCASLCLPATKAMVARIAGDSAEGAAATSPPKKTLPPALLKKLQARGIATAGQAVAETPAQGAAAQGEAAQAAPETAPAQPLEPAALAPAPLPAARAHPCTPFIPDA